MRLKLSLSLFAIVALLSAAFMQPAQAANKKQPAKISLTNYQKKSSHKDWAQRKKTSSHSMPMLKNFQAINMPTLSGIELDGSRTFPVFVNGTPKSFEAVFFDQVIDGLLVFIHLHDGRPLPPGLWKRIC